MASSQQTLADLQNLTTLYRQGHHSPVIERTVEKMVAFERDHARQEAAEINAKLQVFEQQHQMNSEDFYRRFRAGIGRRHGLGRVECFLRDARWCAVALSFPHVVSGNPEALNTLKLDAR